MIIKKNSSIKIRDTEAPGQGKASVSNKVISTKSLSSFLNERRVGSGEDYTHTSLGEPAKGSFYISQGDNDLFFSIYEKYLNEGNTASITEKHKSMSPVLIDLDFRQQCDKRIYDINFVNKFLNILLTLVRDYVNVPMIKCIVLEKKCPRLSKGIYKDGIHIILPNVITSPKIQYKLREKILESYSDSCTPPGVVNTPDDIYDIAVIEKNNWFLYGSKKPDEEFGWRVTRSFECSEDTVTELPMASFSNLLKTMSIRYNVMEESRYTTEGRKVLMQRDIRDDKSERSSISATTIGSHPIIKELVDMLSLDRVDDYKEWMRVGWCLHNIDPTLLPLWEDFSKKSQKYIEGDCEKRWNTMRDEGLNIGSLHRWAKEDSPQEYLSLMSKQRASDDLILVRDIRIAPVLYPYQYVKYVFEKTHSKITDPLCIVEETKDDWLIRDDVTLKKVYLNVYCLSPEDNKKCCFVERWLKDQYARTYEHLGFIPPRGRVDKDTLNMWKGFLIDSIDTPSSGNVDPFLHHVEVLTGFSKEGAKYMINWLAHLIQFPGSLNGIALIFLSEEGAGKNIFWDGFANIIGKKYYYETADPQRDLFGRFCNGRRNKLLIDIDEANTKDTFANSEVLKNIISSQYFNYEDKGLRPITLNNFARLIFTTNNTLCVKISSSERRYVVYETSSKYIGNTKYFKALHEYMNDHGNQKAIIEYLRGIDITEVNWILDRPISETYKALKEICADPILKYLIYYYDVISTESYHIVSSSRLYDTFNEYLRDVLKMKDDGMRYWSYRMFTLRMSTYVKKNIGIEAEGNIGNKKLNGYGITTESLKRYLEKEGYTGEK